MNVRRLAAFGAAVVAGVSVSACTQQGPAILPTNYVSSIIYNYTAIGASDAVGYGASVPCATAAVDIGDDVELEPSPPSCPNGTGYVPDIKRLIGKGLNQVNLTDLGISGAVIGPDIRAIGNEFEPALFGCAASGEDVCVPGDFLDDELPLVGQPINTVTIFAGGNDTDAIFAGAATIAAGGGDPTDFIEESITDFGNDYATLLGTIHTLFPFARIYVANLPNFGLIPRGVCLGATTATAECPEPGDNPEGQALVASISLAIDADVINTLPADHIPVLDLECNAASYNPANFYVDGFHPNDAGYALLAQLYAQAIQHYGAGPPAGNCPPYSVAPDALTRHALDALRGHPIHLSDLRY
ncbi:MAG TPA: SGNH/GDSL hydrolase family protein [Candidatus Eremiobacteraceae bacterium]|nr:SGNH/GDSL hydrolase family protein [Candidatus Eremiobacteraceae bacterium]